MTTKSNGPRRAYFVGVVVGALALMPANDVSANDARRGRIYLPVEDLDRQLCIRCLAITSRPEKCVDFCSKVRKT